EQVENGQQRHAQLMQCIEYFQRLEAEGQGWELESRTREEIEEIESGKGSPSLYAKRTTIINNLYGVDIDEGAVEICKLRLWLSMVADIEDEPSEVEPLPNIDFNVRQGNSLIGQLDTDIESNEDGDSDLDSWEVKTRFEDVKEAIKKHKKAETSVEAQEWRKEAEDRIEEHRDKFDEILRREFQDAGFDDITIEEIREWAPFHWPLEFADVFEKGGFDVFIGNPPWDMLYANRDDFFIRYDEQFRTYPSEEKDGVMEDLLSNPDVAWDWEDYKESMETQADFFTKGDVYKLQSPVVGGRTMPTKNELSALFLERVFRLSRDGVKVSLLLPGTIFGGVMGKDLRTHLLDHTDIENLIGFENKGIFEQIHRQYRFAILTFEYGGKTSRLRGIFNQRSMDVVYNIEDVAAEIPRQVLLNYSPEVEFSPRSPRKWKPTFSAR
ncbi:BREX-1 system adenine-specific DNA-methyltransferase PglX, partial [Halobellus rufus]|uniref:BREX-1 system adenine-specific DNA-methyltransferase PglX n=1 Tax=Halobellus rufus TaxID=1448860 RepID=UPI001E53B693